MPTPDLQERAAGYALQYTAPIGIGLLALMGVFHLCDHWESEPERPETVVPVVTPTPETPIPNPPVTPPVPTVEKDKQTVSTPEVQTPEPPPPPKKEIPAWLPITEGLATGRSSIPMEGVEYEPIEGIENHPERIYQNPDCITQLSNQAFPLHEVMVSVEGQYISTEAILREKAETEALIEKTIPDTASSAEVLPLDSVIIE